MNREQKIEAIYQKIANKELTFGCKIQYKRSHSNEWIVIRTIQNYHIRSWEIRLSRVNGWLYIETTIQKHQILDSDTIWHPVLIWDVLDYLEKKFFRFITSEEEYKETWDITSWLKYWLKKDEMNKILSLLWKWNDKQKPLENQSDECIDYIYNLISDE